MKQVSPRHTKGTAEGSSGAKKLEATTPSPATGDGQNKSQTTKTTKTPRVPAKRAMPPAARVAKSQPQSRPITTLPPALQRPLPAKYFQRAAKAFANFSLSKIPKGPTPPNFVPHKEIKDPAAVQAVHRKIMAHQINELKKADTLNQGLTLTLPKATIKKLFPSYNEKAGKIDLSELLGLMAQKMKGNEFYTQGNPTLNRLALQSRVDQIIKSVTQKGKK